MVDPILLGLVESILGKGKETSKGNYSFKCFNPKCSSIAKGNNKLEINLIPTLKNKNPWNCWVCNSKGTTLKSLFNSIKLPQSKYDQLNNILGTTYKVEKVKVEIQVELPKEFKPFIELRKTNIISRHALHYLINKRGITFEDILKHNIGYCETGRYRNKVIIPSYSKEGKLDYFVARAFMEDDSHKLDAPQCDKNIIGFESLINYDLPLIICEGPFDAIAIKRNAIPLFGKNISPKLREKLMLNSIKSIYLCLDEDALKNTIKITEELISLGKKVYVVRLPSKDPSELGFEKFNNLIQFQKPFTLMDLMKLKMEIN